MRSDLPDLPPELISLILAQLRPRALRRCLLVNSAFHTLAQPIRSAYASTYVVLDDESEVALPLLRDNTKTSIPQCAPKDVSCLTVRVHDRCSTQVRSFFPSPERSPLISSCQVLKVHLAPPDDNVHMANPHKFYFPRAPWGEDEDEYDTEDDPLEDCVMSKGPLECQVLHFALEDATITKLVLRDVPLVYGNVDPNL